jgi:8-oxo-dGTP pyrophosphatase MutT (NUDIX family)
MKITNEYIQSLLQTFSDELPRLPDGRIDYSHSSKAPVLTVFVFYDQSLLLLKRSDLVRTYKGKWNTVAGYIDEMKPLKTKIHEELREEIGILPSSIHSYFFGEPYTFSDNDQGFTWIVHPIKIILNHRPSITIDWEHTEFTWIRPQHIDNYDTVPRLKESLQRILDEH